MKKYFCIYKIFLYICCMKIIIKYHIEFGNEVIVCDSLEQAERKLKHMSETDRYLIKSEYDGDELINQFLIG